jgi:light-regulated signal transduction histidine kinase (bacteriophytochrome)
MKTYHPRFSFKLWQELVKGMSIPWRKEEIAMAENVQEFLRDFNNGKNYDKN